MDKIDPKDIQTEVVDFFAKVGLEVKAKAAKSEEGFEVVLETKDSGLLIGHHGDTLQDFQTVLNLILNNKYRQDTWVRYVLDIGGWRAERENDIKGIAIKAIEKVRTTGEPFTLPPMKPAERRLVHVLVAENPDITSESFGSGADRKVTLALSKS